MSKIHSCLHLGLIPRCGACVDTIFQGEEVIALLGNEDSTYRCRTDRFSFPPPGYPSAFINEFQPCRYPGCSTCAESPEVVLTYDYCLQIFAKKFNVHGALARLWTIGSHRRPWARAPDLYLACERPGHAEALHNIAKHFQLEWLARLPSELLDNIWRFEPHTPFWRAISVLGILADSAAPSGLSQTHLLASIEYWKRGIPIIPISRPRFPLIRLIIDRRGIQKIERVPARTGYYQGGSPYQAYILEDNKILSDVSVHAKDGLLRPHFPHQNFRPPI
ncbi:hypothetical protein FJTKL_00929 [Diaporthe vaccinii]|uniref:Uncharacterized protein n=1 Tax=Diaporthe vaccinii TaxID=105482 RepID=A0ABR4E1U3_9PEZI